MASWQLDSFKLTMWHNGPKHEIKSKEKRRRTEQKRREKKQQTSLARKIPRLHRDPRGPEEM